MSTYFRFILGLQKQDLNQLEAVSLDHFVINRRKEIENNNTQVK